MQTAGVSFLFRILDFSLYAVIFHQGILEVSNKEEIVRQIRNTLERLYVPSDLRMLVVSPGGAVKHK